LITMVAAGAVVMTAPMTRPQTPIMWVIVLAPFVMAIAVPFAHFDGLFGWLAFNCYRRVRVIRGILSRRVLSAPERHTRWKVWLAA
jgi:hypothetical protein